MPTKDSNAGGGVKTGVLSTLEMVTKTMFEEPVCTICSSGYPRDITVVIGTRKCCCCRRVRPGSSKVQEFEFEAVLRTTDLTQPLCISGCNLLR